MKPTAPPYNKIIRSFASNFVEMSWTNTSIIHAPLEDLEGFLVDGSLICLRYGFASHFTPLQFEH